MDPRIEAEFHHRQSMYEALRHAGGPLNVRPEILRELGIYGGAQGIWVDKARTSALPGAPSGVTVAVLHTGSSYPDDLSDSGVLYHYPRTGRPPARDLAEVNATKAAKMLGLPIFVITYPSPGSSYRNAQIGWVDDWDDHSRLFLITFGETPPPPVPIVDDDTPFALTEDVSKKKGTTNRREGQQKFQFQVFKRYGPSCAVCGITVPEVLDAAHIRSRTKDHGSNDPRNGLVLCAAHHRAFDAGLFAIEPSTLRIAYRERGPDAKVLRITFEDLSHLPKKPHPEAIIWAWERWSRG